MGVYTCIMLLLQLRVLSLGASMEIIYYYFNLHWQQAGVSCSHVYMHVRLVRVHTLQYKSFLQISCKLNGFLKKRNVKSKKYKTNNSEHCPINEPIIRSRRCSCRQAGSRQQLLVPVSRRGGVTSRQAMAAFPSFVCQHSPLHLLRRSVTSPRHSVHTLRKPLGCLQISKTSPS